MSLIKIKSKRWLLMLLVTLVVFVGGWWVFRRTLAISTVLVSPLGVSRGSFGASGVSENLVADHVLSLDSIFTSNHKWIEGPPKDKTITMFATGDVILGRTVNYEITKKNNVNWPFEKVADVLKAADLRVINLEAPLVDGCKSIYEGMRFCGDPKDVGGLVFAGANVATLANNHIGNYGVFGVEETKKWLTKSGILPVSTEGPAYLTVKGVKFAFLAYNDVGAPEPGVPWANEKKMGDDITIARRMADIVIVALHWGVEYTSQPTEVQRKLGRLAIDSGADLVIGNHPHWIQALEFYKGKLITYAHGNFVFDQMWSQKTREGVVGRYTFYNNKLVDVDYLPIEIEDFGQPKFLSGRQSEQILSSMREESLKLAKIP